MAAVSEDAATVDAEAGDGDGDGATLSDAMQRLYGQHAVRGALQFGWERRTMGSSWQHAERAHMAAAFGAAPARDTKFAAAPTDGADRLKDARLYMYAPPRGSGSTSVTTATDATDAVGAAPSAALRGIVQLALDRGVPVSLVRSRAALLRIGGDRRHQGVVLEAPTLEAAVPRVARLSTVAPRDSAQDAATRPELCVLADDVVDPMNVGTVARSCDFFGVSRLLLGERSAPLSAVACRAAAGALDRLHVSRCHRKLAAFLRMSHVAAAAPGGTHRLVVVGTVADTSADTAVAVGAAALEDCGGDLAAALAADGDPRPLRVLLLLGSERHGLPPRALGMCHVLLSVPPRTASGAPLHVWRRAVDVDALVAAADNRHEANQNRGAPGDRLAAVASRAVATADDEWQQSLNVGTACAVALGHVTAAMDTARRRQ
jgi:tRNA G18 (ribose-2'-O)-methylase SpoU